MLSPLVQSLIRQASADLMDHAIDYANDDTLDAWERYRRVMEDCLERLIEEVEKAK